MDPVLVLTLRACMSLLFVAAAYHKLRDPRAFELVLARYELVPSSLVRHVAWGVIAMEIYLAMRVLFSWRANLAAAALLSVYGLAIATNVLRGRTDLDCGCTGPAARTPVSMALVGRNGVLAAAAIAAATPLNPRPLVWVDALTMLCAIAAMTACWLASERMLALVPAMTALRRR